MVAKSFHASHIELRHKTYYAVLYIPKDVRFEIGKSKFSRSTESGDRRIAEKRAAAFVIGWQAEILNARHKSVDPLIAEAQDLFLNLKTAASLSKHLVRDVIDERTNEIAHNSKIDGIDAEEFKKIATGNVRVLSSLIPAWIAHEADKGLKQKTIDQMKRDVEMLGETFQTVQTLTAEYATAWIRLIAEDNNLSASSVKRIICFCRNFYRYLQSFGEIEKDKSIPFTVPDEFKKSKKANTKSKNKSAHWLPLTSDQVVALYKAALANGDQMLAALIKIGAYTGARIEEICSLKCKDVYLDDNYFNIVSAKSHAGIRSVPIHSKIKIRVKELIYASKDGYLLSGLTFNKYHDRSNSIGKRFGRLKAKLGFSKLQVFHSIRKTLVTMLENAEISENLAADIVGHEKPRITYGLYSGGASIDVKKKAIQKISYNFD